MAEGGSHPEVQLNKDNTALTYQFLECPICLDQMRSPKSLPCLHSFCEECLGTYIVTDLSDEMAAVTSFPCPVCRKKTSPVNHSESKETWAQQFSSNSLVQYFTSHNQTVDTPLQCSPCRKTKYQETPAKFLCKAVGTLFCEYCKIHFHDIVHESCEIVSLNAENRDATRQQSMTMSCSIHNKNMAYYCKDHQVIGCKKCMVTDHRRCDEVMTIKEYCGNQKDNSKLDDMDKSLGKAVNCTELMLNAFDKEVETLQQCQDSDLSSIADLRQRINAFLDQKQEEITQEMVSKHKAVKTKIDLLKWKCSRLRTAMQNTREASKMAVGMSYHLGMIQLFHRGQTEIGACNDLIDDVKLSPQLITSKHEIDSSLITIDESSTLTLGRILVEEKPCSVPDGVGYIQNVDSLSNSHVKKVAICMLKVPSDLVPSCIVHGVLLMPIGSIIVSDYQHDKLKLFSSKGQYLDELKIHGYPHDVCSVDADTVAVAVTNRQVGIHVVKVKPSKLTLLTVIKVSKEITCLGLTFMDGKFMVSTSTDIHSVTMDGKVDKVQTLSAQCWHLASDLEKNRTYAYMPTSVNDTIVTRLPNGIHIYSLATRIVRKPMGVDVDREGNVYVCGQDSNNVVQVSANGTKVRELLTSKDGISKPRAVSVCGNKFVVSNESEENPNELHVYQLY